jgi:hypothetical protein
MPDRDGDKEQREEFIVLRSRFWVTWSVWRTPFLDLPRDAPSSGRDSGIGLGTVSFLGMAFTG